MVIKKEERTTQIIPIGEMKLECVLVSIKGTNQLVTQPFPLKSMIEIAEKQNNPKLKGQKKEYAIRNPYKDVIESCYILSELPNEIKTIEIDWSAPKGYTDSDTITKKTWDNVAKTSTFGVHIGGLKSAIAQIAVDRKLVKSKAVAYGAFFIKGAISDKLYSIPCIPLKLNTPPIMRTDCLSTFNSGADMRYRPQFNEWGIDFEIEFDADMLPLDQLLTWIKFAGISKGLCEYRPEKGGSWGTFELKEVKKIL